MKNCYKCENAKDLSNNFDIIGKTYYVLPNGDVLCFRHWHQAGRPEYAQKGDYHSLSPVKKKNDVFISLLRDKKLFDK
jgi:hypothetical protein